MLKNFILGLFLVSTFNSSAQLQRLEELGQKMLQNTEAPERAEAQILFTILLDSLMLEPSFFEKDLQEVKSLSAITSPDRELRLYTWNEPQKDGTYNFYGRILFNPKKAKTNKVIKLKEKKQELARIKTKKLNDQEWFGAIYYQLIQKSHKRNTYYILLGWNGNTALSNIKLIDVLQVSKNGQQVSFGAPIFTGNQTLSRVIFEYSEKASMSLKFQDNGSRIVFDHLSPINTNMKDQFEFYSPDFTYDSYNWKKGKWIFNKNIDARNDGLNAGDQRKKPEKGLQPK
jgi:hypothetical protein